MESTKQLVDLISNVYADGMNILDVGCNVGHYLSGIRRKFPKLDYVGVDAYSNYIEKAKKSFISNSHAKFEVKDIFQSNSIQDEFENTKNESHIGTKILGENQVIENVICNWSWMKITKN